MNESHELAVLRDPRFSAHVTSALPVWLWALDASEILWANAAGAAIFGAPNAGDLTQRRFEAGQPAAQQVARLASTLRPGAAPRLERLRGFGAGFGRALVCLCSSIELAGGGAGLLIAAAEPAGPNLSLAERVRGIFLGPDHRSAVFSPDGELLHAGREADESLTAAGTLHDIGAEALAAEALSNGHARGHLACGRVTIERLGSGADIVLLAKLGEEDEPVSDEAVGLTDAEPPATPPAETPQPVPLGAPAPEQRPQLTVVPAAKNVLPFRSTASAQSERRPALTTVERNAFQEIAKALGAQFETATDGAGGGDQGANAGTRQGDRSDETAATAAAGEADMPASFAGGSSQRNRPRHRVLVPSAFAAGAGFAWSPETAGERMVLDRMPSAAVVYRGDHILYANAALLDWTGFADIDALADAGGVARLFAEPGVALLGDSAGTTRTIALTPQRGEPVLAKARLFSLQWEGESALLIVLTAEPTDDAGEARARHAADIERHELSERAKSAEAALASARSAVRELEATVSNVIDGVVIVDREGKILSHNVGVDALFGYGADDLGDRSFLDLLAPQSRGAARDYFNNILQAGPKARRQDGIELMGQDKDGGPLQLSAVIAPLDGAMRRYGIGLRDIGPWKRAEDALTGALRQAEKASSAKSDFLAKISHEIRTPLNAMIGFSEVMIEERFGPIENERYRQYIKDVHTSGQHIISLVNDLLDLSKIEAGKLDLNLVSVDLNEIVKQCVALMQPQTNRERVIIRSALAPALPPIVADERSVRQIVLNLMSNSIKFTGAGGQVIVSTTLTDKGDVVLRVRDTGVGMSEKELATALEPFRQVATSGRLGSAGTGLGLPLTKALAEANGAKFNIKSAVEAGTLVEIAFASARVDRREQR